MAFTGRGGAVSFGGSAAAEVNSWSFSYPPSEAVEYSTFDGKFTVPGPAGAATGSFKTYAVPPYDPCPAAISLAAGGSAACGSADSVVVTGSAFCTGFNIEAPADGVVEFTVEFSFVDTPNIA